MEISDGNDEMKIVKRRKTDSANVINDIVYYYIIYYNKFIYIYMVLLALFDKILHDF